MTQAALYPLVDAPEATSSEEKASNLSSVGIGQTAVVVSLGLEEDLSAWLRAVGIREGERVTVLRRAVFGGPIHVRTGAGGEFALHGSLASQVIARVVPRR